MQASLAPGTHAQVHFQIKALQAGQVGARWQLLQLVVSQEQRTEGRQGRNRRWQLPQATPVQMKSSKLGERRQRRQLQVGRMGRQWDGGSVLHIGKHETGW